MRPQRLRRQWADFLVSQSTFPVFLTIQPNTAWGTPLLVQATPGDRSPEGRIWAFVKALFLELDRRRTGCPKPGLLAPDDRYQGWAVIERRDRNIHLHMILKCRDVIDQTLAALALFESLDNVPSGRSDPRDDAWQQDAWQFVTERRWLRDAGRTRTISPLLKRYASGATAMVQIVRNEHDRERVCRYMTKELSGSSVAMAQTSEHWANKTDFLVRELREFHSKIGAQKPASCIRIDRDTGAQVLNLDDPNPWKQGGKRIR